jgi:hypothetical protein
LFDAIGPLHVIPLVAQPIEHGVVEMTPIASHAVTLPFAQVCVFGVHVTHPEAGSQPFGQVN